MNRWVLVTLVLTVFLILGFFLTYSQVQSIASTGEPSNSGYCSKLNLYVTAITTTSGNCAQVNQGFNQTGLTLYAQLDEGSGSAIYDLSSEGIIGAANNQSSVNWIKDTSCIFQQFCWLNNKTSNNFISLGHDYNDSANNPISMCQWVYPTTLVPTTYGIFGDTFGNTGKVFGFSMQYDVLNRRFQFYRYNQSLGLGVVQNSNSAPENEWYFICGSYTGSIVNLYVNGTFIGSNTDTRKIIGISTAYLIGFSNNVSVAKTNGRFSAFYQFNHQLTNSTALALYEYVPNPTEQNPVLWQQLTGFPSNCPINQYVIGFTTTLSCSSASNSNYLTTQTSAFFSYGTCPANQFATAITTTTLNCAAVSTEAVASCATGQFATTEGANGGFGCGNPNINFQNNSNTCTDTTATTVLMAGFKLSYTAVGTGQVYVTIDWKLSTPATSSINTQFRIAFGTGTAPNCNAAVIGTKVGNEMEVGTFAAVASFETISLTVGVLTLTSGTTYWFDIQMFDSTGASWIYSLPQMAVMES